MTLKLVAVVVVVDVPVTVPRGLTVVAAPDETEVVTDVVRPVIVLIVPPEHVPAGLSAQTFVLTFVVADCVLVPVVAATVVVVVSVPE